jgi:acyl-coenzyme A thioesterase PaaI-like protein
LSIDPTIERPWEDETAEGYLVARGHPAGDVLEAWDWRVLTRTADTLRIACSLPEHLKNPRGQLFGGFTGTYVDFVCLHTLRGDPTTQRGFQSTINMRIDYFEPITGPTFEVEGKILKLRGKTSLVSASFYVADELAVYSISTFRDVGD